MKALAILLAFAVLVPSAAAASKAERCAKYAEQLHEIEEAKKRGGSEARMHKLESKRQKILAARAKHKC